MRLNSFLEVTLLASAALPNFAAASGGDINIPGAQQPLSPPKIAGWDVIEGVLMDDCDAKISVCGKVANLKVVHEHAKTSYFTNYKTFEDVVTLEPEFVTVTKVEIITTTTSTEGQCRSTTTIIDEKPLILTVDVNVTTTREFVPVKTTTTTRISTVSEKAIEQCLVRTSVALPNPSPPVKESSPPVNPPIAAEPPVKQPVKDDPSPRPKSDNNAKPSVSPSNTPKGQKA